MKNNKTKKRQNEMTKFCRFFIKNIIDRRGDRGRNNRTTLCFVRHRNQGQQLEYQRRLSHKTETLAKKISIKLYCILIENMDLL